MSSRGILRVAHCRICQLQVQQPTILAYAGSYPASACAAANPKNINHAVVSACTAVIGAPGGKARRWHQRNSLPPAWYKSGLQVIVGYNLPERYWIGE